MKQNREWSIKATLGLEGGYVNDPNDNGGPTNFGVTIHTLREWRKNPLLDHKAILDLKLPEVVDIYTVWYWNPVWGDKLPSGVDYVVFDMAINAGPRQATKLLQRVVDTKQDGEMGPVTLAAAQAMDPKTLIQKYTEARMRFYRSLKDWQHFGNGWNNRVAKAEAHALEALRGPVQSQEPQEVSTTPKTQDGAVDPLTEFLRALVQLFIRWLKSQRK